MFDNRYTFCIEFTVLNDSFFTGYQPFEDYLKLENILYSKNYLEIINYRYKSY